MTSTFSIGDLSKEFEVTPRTIRFYEAQGLIAPERQGQTRIYDTRDRVYLKLILRGKRLGFSLKEIKELIDLYDAPQGEVSQLTHFMQRMGERREILLAQRRDIDKVLEELVELEDRCRGILGEHNGGHQVETN